MKVTVMPAGITLYAMLYGIFTQGENIRVVLHQELYVED